MSSIVTRTVLWVASRSVELRRFSKSRWVRDEKVLSGGREAFAEPAQMQAALCALLGKLGEPGKISAERLDVIVSDSLCRSLVVPRLQGAAGRAEVESALRMRLQRQIGDEAQAWLLSTHVAPFARFDLVVGMPRQLLNGIEAEAVRLGLHVASVRPFWIHCAEETNFPRGKAITWLLAGSPDARTLALFEGKRCIGVRSAGAQPPLSVAQQIARDGVLLDPPAQPVGCTVWGDGFVPETMQVGAIPIQRAVWPGIWAGYGRTERQASAA